MPTYTFTSSLLTAINRYSRFNALSTPFYDSDALRGKGGYACAGVNGSTQVSSIEKMPFATETFFVLSQNWTHGGSTECGLSAPLAGYSAGAFSGTPLENLSTVSKMLFSTETVSNLAGNLSSTRRHLGGFASTTNGYFVGGFPTQNLMQKVVFSTDTVSLLPNNLNTGRALYGSATQSSTHGFVFGGFSGVTTIEKISFSTETSSLLSAPNTFPAQATTLPSVASSTAAYNLGGEVASSLVSTVRKLLFSNDTLSSLGDLLTSARRGQGFHSSEAGYAVNGASTSVDKILFSTETVTRLASGQSIERSTGHGFANI